MRAFAFLGSGLAVLAVIYILAAGPRPDTPGQIAARDTVEALTRARVAALAHGDVGGWANSFAADGRFVSADFAAPVPGPNAAAALAHDEIGAGAGAVTYDQPGTIHAGASRRGRLAWAVAEIGSSREAEAEPVSPLRLSVAYLLVDDRWRVVLEHHSRAWAGGDAAGPAAGAVRAVAADWIAAPRPDEVPAVAAHGIAALNAAGGSSDVERPFRKQLAHLSHARVERDALILGPTEGEFAAGDSAARELLADWESRYGALVVAPADLWSETVGGRGVGWAVANVESRPAGANAAPLRLRFSVVYRSRGEGSWGLVLAHLSAAPDTAAARPAAGVVGN